jgi:hypothetical protein
VRPNGLGASLHELARVPPQLLYAAAAAAANAANAPAAAAATNADADATAADAAKAFRPTHGTRDRYTHWTL